MDEENTNDGLTEKEEDVADDDVSYDCIECHDEGWVEDEDGDRQRCPFCNPKISIEEQMDDDS